MSTKQHDREGLARIRYGSHLSLLTKYLWELQKYPLNEVTHIVEHGCGAYSSPVIATFCGELNLQRVVVETDEEWAKEYAGYNIQCNSVAAFRRMRDFPIGLVLIDGNQYDRQPMIEACKDAKFIVVHDTEHMALYRYNFDDLVVVERSIDILPETTVLTRRE